MSRSKLAGALALAAVVAPILALSACSSSEDGASPAGASGASDAATTAEITVASVTGRLDAAGEEAVSSAVATVVGDFLEAAYVGDFPRSNFDDAFAAFSSGAQARASKDLDLLTSAALSESITSARLDESAIELDILSPKNVPAGVTARWSATFQTQGSLTSTQSVQGSFALTPVDGSWQIFGYDVSQGPAVPTAPTTSTTGAPQ